MPVGGPLPDWARAHGPPPAAGVLRDRPEDFQVEELPLVEPDGDGAHLWLELRKRDANTAWVASELARAAGIPPREVGYAGMKDRRAVTTQWFSLNLQQAPEPDPSSWRIPGVEILQTCRHPRKLRRGALRGNRFRIAVRQLTGDRDALAWRLQTLREQGLPNYFGEQRFGHGGRNVARAANWLEHGGRVRRSERGILISAMRSFLFNEVLAARVREGSWNRLLDGDVAQLDGRRSVFPCSLPDPELERRCMDGDIHPTGPLVGRGGLCSERAAAAVESAALEGHADWIAALERIGADAARRSLRLVPAELGWTFEGDDLLLEFSLPSGAYATALLRELVSTPPGTISDSA